MLSLFIAFPPCSAQARFVPNPDVAYKGSPSGNNHCCNSVFRNACYFQLQAETLTEPQNDVCVPSYVVLN